MIKDAVDYGYLPPEVRDNLNVSSKAPVSRQVKDLITEGRVGPDGFIFSLRAALTESLHYADHAPSPVWKHEYLAMASHYSQALKSDDFQKTICESMIDECNYKLLRASKAGDRMSSRFYRLGGKRWGEVLKSITPSSYRGHLRIVT